MSVHTSISSAPKGAANTVTREGTLRKVTIGRRDSVGDFRQTENPTDKRAEEQCLNSAACRKIQVLYLALKTCPQDSSGVMA